MEALGGAAAVLAFAGLAAKSTKNIYLTICGIKGGPKQLQDIASAVKELEQILSQIERSSILREADTSLDLVELKTLLERCEKDIEGYERVLQRLQISPLEKGPCKTWKKVKTMLQDKDLQRTWDGIQHYVTTLGLQVQFIQTFVLVVPTFSARTPDTV